MSIALDCGKLDLHSVDVSLPKFKTTAQFSLAEALNCSP
jgi:hypothetical protein